MTFNIKCTSKKVRISDICEVFDGPHATPKKTQSGPIYLGIDSITDDGHINPSGYNHLSSEDYAIWTKRVVPQENDLVFTYEATLGRYALIPKAFCGCLGRRVALLRIKDNKVNPRWLLYYFLSSEWKTFIDSRTVIGSTVNRIPIKAFPDYEILLPPIETQNNIATILGNIDDHIEINKRINDNLSQQALGIFTRMFAASESTIPATIADVSLNVTDGVHNTVHDDPNGQYLLLSCKNIKGGSLSISKCERRINQETFEKLRRRTKLAKGDVLISSVGTVGELMLLNTDPVNYEFQRSVAIVKPNSKIVSSSYLYSALMSKRAELINAAHGAVQQCLFISDIAGFPVNIPSPSSLQKFDSLVVPMFDNISNNEAENAQLAMLRDTLLPRLMTGEIDISK